MEIVSLRLRLYKKSPLVVITIAETVLEGTYNIY